MIHAYTPSDDSNYTNLQTRCMQHHLQNTHAHIVVKKSFYILKIFGFHHLEELCLCLGLGGYKAAMMCVTSFIEQ